MPPWRSSPGDRYTPDRRRLFRFELSDIVIAMGIAGAVSAAMLPTLILSCGIPFALIPLVIYTSRRDIMGHALVNRRGTTALAWIITTLVVALNTWLLWSTIVGQESSRPGRHFVPSLAGVDLAGPSRGRGRGASAQPLDG